MTTSKTQTRGNCQCCGREQAVTRGAIAQHGYTVENGYFSGVCNGHLYPPMQIERAAADRLVEMVRQDASGLRVKAAQLRSGDLLPADDYAAASHQPGEAKIPFAQMTSWRQREVADQAIYRAEQRAKMAVSFADSHEALVAAKHGTPLVIVARPEAPAEIVVGERRRSTEGLVDLTCTGVLRGGRVEYTYQRGEKTFRTACTTRYWRGLPMVVA